jgi:protein gp37
MTRRLEATGQQRYQGLTTGKHFNGVVRCHPDVLELPKKWKRPRLIFVNSMSDLFHQDVPFDFIDHVFDVMYATPQHTYQVLTKRPMRMIEYIHDRASARQFGWTDVDRSPFLPGEFVHFDTLVYRNECGYVGDEDEENGIIRCEHPENAEGECHRYGCPIAWLADTKDDLEQIGLADEYEFDEEGLAEDCEWMKYSNLRPRRAAVANVWLGFSAEDQATFESRMREFSALRHILGPYFTLFCSLEPLLGPIDFCMRSQPDQEPDRKLWNPLEPYIFQDAGYEYPVPFLNWVITGGESGPHARPAHPDWFRWIRDQCAEDGIPFFFKQWGEFAPQDAGVMFSRDLKSYVIDELGRPFSEKGGGGQPTILRRVGKQNAGRLLDGKLHDDYPAREMLQRAES